STKRKGLGHSRFSDGGDDEGTGGSSAKVFMRIVAAGDGDALCAGARRTGGAAARGDCAVEGGKPSATQFDFGYRRDPANSGDRSGDRISKKQRRGRRREGVR